MNPITVENLSMHFVPSRHNGLVKSNGKKKTSNNNIVKAVNNLNFEVKKGEIFGFIGPNGAGKTTTIRMLTAILKPTAGSSKLFGVDIFKNPLKVKQVIGSVPEMANIFPELTGMQNILLIAKLYDIPKAVRTKRAVDLLKQFGLFEKRDVKTKTYSKGMKQRILLCMALVSEPKVLFLDEPTSGLDVLSARIIKKVIKDYNKKGNTIFITTHNMQVANELCDRIAIINKGEIACIDTPENLKKIYSTTNKISVVFNAEIDDNDLKALDSILSLSRTKNRWLLEVKDVDAALNELLKFARTCSVKILELSTHQSNLEDIFVKIIKGCVEN